MGAILAINKPLELDKVDWVEYLQVADQSRATYRKNIKPFFMYLQQERITQPKEQDVINFTRSLTASGYKTSSQQAYLTAVKVFFRWLKKEGLYSNIAQDIKSERTNALTHRKGYLSDDQAAQLLDSVDINNLTGLRNYAILLLQVTGGLRCIEISRAKVKDYKGDYLEVYGKGRTSADDSVNLDEETRQAINDYLAARTPEYNEPLFASHSRNTKHTGQPLTTRQISRIAKEHLKKIGIDDTNITSHSLRHSMATIAINAGQSLDDVQRAMRHADPKTTLRYVHDINQRANKTASIVAAAISSKRAKNRSV